MAVPDGMSPVQRYADRCEDLAISHVCDRLALLHTIEDAYRVADSRIRLEQAIALMRSGAGGRGRHQI